MTSFSTPKTKPEYVTAIEARTYVSRVELSKHSVDRLKEIWMLVRPVKMAPLLPTGWKKMDLETLKNMYYDNVMTYYARPDDGHWSRWKRAQLITELELWIEDRKEEMAANGENLNEPMAPVCEQCNIPCIARTNRVDKGQFWGCVRFPACRTTYPMSMAGMETKTLQEEINKGYPNKRRAEKALSSVASGSDGNQNSTPWEMMTEEDTEEGRLINANLSAEEAEIVANIRKEKERLAKMQADKKK